MILSQPNLSKIISELQSRKPEPRPMSTMIINALSELVTTATVEDALLNDLIYGNIRTVYSLISKFYILRAAAFTSLSSRFSVGRF